MPSAGEHLRSERVKRNRTLAELAKETRIGIQFLTAIEADDTAALPGDFFHRSFIRQYGAALGLEPSEIAQILSLLAPPPAIDLMPILGVPKAAEVESQAKPLARVPTRVAAILLIAVSAGGSALYAFWNRAQDRAQEREDGDLQVETRSGNASPPPGASNPPAQDAAAAPPSIPPAAPLETRSRAEDSAPQQDPGKINLGLSATEKTWVSLSSAGRTIFAGILGPSDTKNFALEANGKLLTGNAAGLDISMNGRPLGPIGPRGSVRIVLFSQDQFEIVSPSRM